MKILVVADVHGDLKTLSKITENVSGDFDVVLCPGDFTDMGGDGSGFKQTDTAEMVVQKLLSMRKPLLCVPGNHDPFEIVDIFNDYGVNLHGKKKELGGIYFAGFGGAKTPFFTNYEPDEEEVENVLERFYSPEERRMVLLTHAPPFNTTLDSPLENVHVGYKSIRRFVEKQQPLLNVCAHIHEKNGVDIIGRTKIFYPGPAYNGNYGIVSIEGEAVECKIKSIKSQILRHD